MTDALPSPLEMVHDLHRAIYGDTWARPEPPHAVWQMLLNGVRRNVTRSDQPEDETPDHVGSTLSAASEEGAQEREWRDG